MRLIDAHAFCKEMKDRQNECAKWRDETDDADIKIRADGALSAFIECKLTLDKMPTVEERKTGKWMPIGQKQKHGYEWMRCSECGMEEIDVPAARTKYCPNCGARMEES